MRFCIMLLALAALVGCTQYYARRDANLAEAAQERAASDDAACRSSGLQPGTPAYEQCRTSLGDRHAQENRRQQGLANQMLNAHPLHDIGQ
ncbi:MAG TPA: hypothetical protein VFA57_03845 [Pseudolabrys sp.]|nr:hypothetical protein [Pseudolabrys sp.]